MDFKTHCKHVFGTYVEAHDDSTVINNMALRTYICISLGLSRNIQGSQKVFGIYTGKVQKLIKLIEFPMPNRVLHRMNAWVQQ